MKKLKKKVNNIKCIMMNKMYLYQEKRLNNQWQDNIDKRTYGITDKIDSKVEIVVDIIKEVVKLIS